MPTATSHNSSQQWTPFAQSTLSFLGHTVSNQGTTPLPSAVEAIDNIPQPQSLKDFYRHFIPAAAALLHPLTYALTGNPDMWLGLPP